MHFKINNNIKVFIVTANFPLQWIPYYLFFTHASRLIIHDMGHSLRILKHVPDTKVLRSLAKMLLVCLFLFENWELAFDHMISYQEKEQTMKYFVFILHNYFPVLCFQYYKTTYFQVYVKTFFAILSLTPSGLFYNSYLIIIYVLLYMLYAITETT